MTGLRKQPPVPQAMAIQNLVDSGMSINHPLAKLATSPTIESADQALAMPDGASVGVRQLRRSPANSPEA